MHADGPANVRGQACKNLALLAADMTLSLRPEGAQPYDDAVALFHGRHANKRHIEGVQVLLIERVATYLLGCDEIQIAYNAKDRNSIGNVEARIDGHLLGVHGGHGRIDIRPSIERYRAVRVVTHQLRRARSRGRR